MYIVVVDGPFMGIFDVSVIDYDVIDNIYLVQYFWQGVGDKEKTKEYAFVYLSDGKIDDIKTT